MGVFDSFAISASGLTAEKLRLDLIANNIANMNTAGRIGDAANPPYRRKMPVFEQILRKMDVSRMGYKGAGVRVAQVLVDAHPPRMEYEPDNPLADEGGYVAYPNINLVNEMVDLISASRSYEANVTALNAAKDIALKALEIGRG
ncbi:MAG: flagellar basal body rod protein FlgC [Peptococcaceae bacterium]|nr:flagellar basal body rod protein FlgC [Peptococcaceae bacterium]